MSSVLDQQTALLRQIVRQPYTPGCDPAPPKPAPEWLPDLQHIPIDATAAGDTVLIAAGARILVHAIELWNVSAQTLILSAGPSVNAANRLLRLTNFGNGQGHILGLSKMTWFEIAAGQPLVLNLSASSQVDGFVRYRLT